MDFSIVFFFKQKTAYEMRISDWSSDVCSSDLFVWLDGLRPETRDPRFHHRQSRLIGQKARIDGGRIGDHPEPETRRPPAIGHGLPDIDHIQPPHRTVPRDHLLKPAPDSGVVARFGWNDQRHATFGDRKSVG